MGNRLYAMASAHEFARQTGRELTVLWPLRWELNSRFTDFWELNGFNLVYTDEYNLPWRWLNKPRLRERILGHGAEVITDADMYRIRDEIGSYDFEHYLEKFSDTNKLFIETCFNFHPKIKTPLKNLFIPKADILKEMSNWEADNGTDYIGMHIRRTDHANAIGHSPDELFLDVIQSSNDKILLCTDDLETENKLKRQFGSRILTFSTNKSRDSKDGIRNAVIDLMLLSRSSKIYGSFNSTFSSFAAEYNAIPLIVLKT